MSHQETNGVAKKALPPGALPEEEYRKLIERLAAEHTPEPTDELLQYWADFDWAENDPELKKHHAGTWLAIHKRQLLASGDDLEAVYLEAQEKTGLPRNQIAVLVIPTDDYCYWDIHAGATPRSH